MSDPIYKFKREIDALNGLFVSESHHFPAHALKRNSTGQVFITLNYELMRRAINFDGYSFLREDEVYYSPQTKEWVLGPVRLSEEAHHALKSFLRHSLVLVQSSPVTEKQVTPPEWGPESP